RQGGFSIDSASRPRVCTHWARLQTKRKRCGLAKSSPSPREPQAIATVFIGDGRFPAAAGFSRLAFGRIQGEGKNGKVSKIRISRGARALRAPDRAGPGARRRQDRARQVSGFAWRLQ